MSELTQCNYCSLANIKRRAYDNNETVRMFSGGQFLNTVGIYVCVVPKDITDVMWKKMPVGNWDSGTGRLEYAVSNFMELSKSCVC